MVFKINRAEFSSKEEFIKSGRRCGAPNPSDLQRDRVRREIASLRQSIKGRVESVTINVQFHHITRGSEGAITEEQRKKQMDVLNQAYSRKGIKFTYKPESVVTVNKPAWFSMGMGSIAESEAKTELQLAPENNLNIYTAELQSGLLGWATFPFDMAGNPKRDGVVVLYSTFPGGDAAPYNEGQTLTHEVGHWLGLYHTFQGGCGGMGDELDDTPSHEGPVFGCPGDGSNGACNPGEKAPIHNYMNYTDDGCMNEFTDGQFERIFDQILTYRSGLLIGPDAIIMENTP